MEVLASIHQNREFFSGNTWIVAPPARQSEQNHACQVWKQEVPTENLWLLVKNLVLLAEICGFWPRIWCFWPRI
jgi:hypothetical protein